MKKILLLTILLLSCNLFFNSCSKDSNSFNDSPQNIGQGGSLARFIIVGDYLYVVDNSMLHTYHIGTNGLPNIVDSKNIGFNIETIFNLGDKILIGSQNAMYIYDIATPSNPQFLSMASHLRACDPVVAINNTAYVTIRSSINNPGGCGGTTNALMVYDISNIQQPILKNSLSMENPHGLAVSEEALYVCQASFGLKIFKRNSTQYEVEELTTVSKEGYSFIDCFIKDNYLYTMFENGFSIWDISQPYQPTEVSNVTY